MKALKINVAITTNAGFDLPSGSVAAIEDIVVKPLRSRGANFVNHEFALAVFTADSSITGGKKRVNSLLADTNFPLNFNVDVPVANYEDSKEEVVFVQAVKKKLEDIYGLNITIITV